MAKLAGLVFMLLLLTAQPLVAHGLLCEIASTVGGAVLVTAGAPLALGAAGFGAGGIVAGSAAAKFMSLVYSTDTGISILAGLQSAGAAGVGKFTSFLGGMAGFGACQFVNNDD